MEPSFFLEDKFLKVAFKRFDIDSSGYITAKNIQKNFARRGFILKDQEVASLISDFDIDQSKAISLNEFLIMMKSAGTDKRFSRKISKIASISMLSETNLRTSQTEMGGGDAVSGLSSGISSQKNMHKISAEYLFVHNDHSHSGNASQIIKELDQEIHEHYSNISKNSSCKQEK